jgi:hypothetical protein
MRTASNLYPLRIGRDILQRLHVYIATKENMMYFTGVEHRDAIHSAICARRPQLRGKSGSDRAR